MREVRIHRQPESISPAPRVDHWLGVALDFCSSSALGRATVMGPLRVGLDAGGWKDPIVSEILALWVWVQWSVLCSAPSPQDRRLSPLDTLAAPAAPAPSSQDLSSSQIPGPPCPSWVLGPGGFRGPGWSEGPSHQQATVCVTTVWSVCLQSVSPP